jgi:uncharacterized iron-regulated membrane protein
LRTQYERWYDVHSWTGLVLGLGMFVVCFSGTVAVLFDQLEAWEQRPHLTVPAIEISDMQLDDVLENFTSEYPNAAEHFVLFLLPTKAHPWLRVRGFDEETSQLHMLNYHPGTAQVLGQANGNAEFLRGFHTDLHLPSPYGRYLVGIFGIVLLLLTVGGLMIHNKLRKNPVALRTGKNKQLFFSDMHKLIGVWGVVFHIMIAFTGAMIGLVGFVLLVFAFIRFDGDQEAAFNAILGEPLREAHELGELRSLQEFVRQTTVKAPDLKVTSLSVQHQFDRNSLVNVGTESATHLVNDKNYSYRGSTGELYSSLSLREQGPGLATFAAMTPLHYGTWGGVGLKLIYFVMGILLSSLAVSGVTIWVEKRIGQKREYYHYDRWYSGLALGICLGMPLATSALLVASVLGVLDASLIFFPILFSSIIFATLLHRRFPIAMMLSCASAILLAVAVFYDIIMRSHLPLTLDVLVVDVAMALGSICLGMFSAQQLRKRTAESLLGVDPQVVVYEPT